MVWRLLLIVLGIGLGFLMIVGGGSVPPATEQVPTFIFAGSDTRKLDPQRTTALSDTP